MTRVVVVSDLHLVYKGTNVEAIGSLLDDLRANPPDELVLLGDLFELWRGDLAGMMWLASDVSNEFARLQSEHGVNVVYVQGNHDDYLSRNLDWDRGYPFEQRLDYRAEYDGQEYFFTHGHKYEVTYLPPTNDALAMTNDKQGGVADFVWGNRPAKRNPFERAAMVALGPAASFFDPDALTYQDARRQFVEAGIKRESGEGVWGVYGHTHVPLLDEEGMVVNTGSMTGEQSTYVEIIGGTPHIRGNVVHAPKR